MTFFRRAPLKMFAARGLKFWFLHPEMPLLTMSWSIQSMRIFQICRIFYVQNGEQNNVKVVTLVSLVYEVDVESQRFCSLQWQGQKNSYVYCCLFTWLMFHLYYISFLCIYNEMSDNLFTLRFWIFPLVNFCLYMFRQSNRCAISSDKKRVRAQASHQR